MYAKKLVVNIQDSYNKDLRDKLSRVAPDEQQEEILKDAHLLEAALATDKIVASMDKEARDSYACVCQQIGEIRDIMWVNPEIEKNSCTGWLKKGAPVEPERQLGYSINR